PPPAMRSRMGGAAWIETRKKQTPAGAGVCLLPKLDLNLAKSWLPLAAERSRRLLGRLDHLLAGVLERGFPLGGRRRLAPSVGGLLHRVLHLGAGGLRYLGVDALGVLLHPLVAGGHADLVVATGGLGLFLLRLGRLGLRGLGLRGLGL